MDLARMGAISPQQMLDMMEIGGVQTLVDRMRIDMRAAQRENLKMKQLTEDMILQFNQGMMKKALQGAPGTVDPQRGIPTVDAANLSTYPPVVKVNKWDNHAVHVTTHNNFRKTQAFELLSPMVQDQFDRHITIHESYQMMSQQNPMFAMAQQGMPQEAMGMTPEMQTGPQDPSMGGPPPQDPSMGGGAPPSMPGGGGM
jgi:hypothetical protein